MFAFASGAKTGNEAAEKETGEIDKKRDKEQEVEEEPQVGPPHRQDLQE